MIKLTGLKAGIGNQAEITAFADTKSEVTSRATITGMPEGLVPAMGSAIITAGGEVAFLKSDGTWNWVASSGGGGGGASSFADLDDVLIGTLADGQVPVYNATYGKWENQNVPNELPTPVSGDNYKVAEVGLDKAYKLSMLNCHEITSDMTQLGSATGEMFTRFSNGQVPVLHFKEALTIDGVTIPKSTKLACSFYLHTGRHNFFPFFDEDSSTAKYFKVSGMSGTFSVVDA